ncbi:MAG: Rieske (2Fe-2S) protein, partial [Alphaproteobacteria bacterium]
RAAPLEELKAKGKIVVSGVRCPLLVVYDRGAVRALDNRCPHLGFPLHRGSVEDGILTCHWHHARFDLSSGATFDLWADDVPTAEVRIIDGEVWVAADCALPDQAEHWRRRLNDGLAHNISLVIGKAILGARAAGVPDGELVRDVALFGARHRDGWGTGLTTLTALANLLPSLPDEERFLALFHGARSVAADCDDEPPRRDNLPLEGSDASLETLERWLRHWTRVRHRDGAERTLMTAIAGGAGPSRLARMLLTAVTDRYFAGGGHALDFINKAFECLDLIGWQHASALLPTVVGQLVSARGAEETNSWRHPTDLFQLLEAAFADLPDPIERAGSDPAPFSDHSGLARDLLADDPVAIVDALRGALARGAAPTDLSRALVYAAALRIARFGTNNELSDWDTAHHCFTYCNALDRLLARATATEGENADGAPACLRGVFHGAMALYLTRYLNVPPARLPGEGGDSLEDLPSAADELCDRLLEALDRQQQVTECARLVARFLGLGHPADRCIETLAHGLLREDAGFHTIQMFEAGICQHRDRDDGEERRNILIAVARYLAAHSPTRRARYQTASIARRLHRGGRIYEDETEDAPAPDA